MGKGELENKRILLCVTGSIAAYKSAELARALKKDGASVRVVLSASAEKFITPLIFESLTGELTYTDMFAPRRVGIEHIELSRFADIIVIAPASYNTIGKISSGIADNLVTAVVASSKVPVLIVPAMNSAMYENPVLVDRINYLKQKGYLFVEPDVGELACGESGRGRFPRIELIVETIKDILLGSSEFSGLNFLVSAGRTVEPIDPVRYISNWSSGRMGYTIARLARRMGACVNLISGIADIEPPLGVNTVFVKTVEDMRREVLKFVEASQVVIMSAAISDFRPRYPGSNKFKKGELNSIELEPTPDILRELGRMRKKRVLVGFALESENIIQNAQRKLAEKKIDLIVANTTDTQGSDYLTGFILSRDGVLAEFNKTPKVEVAKTLLVKLYDLLKKFGFC